MADYPVVKVAAVQAAPVFMDLDATVDKTCRLIDEAAAQGAKVIGFPESYIPGYPWWIWMDSPLKGMPFYIQLYKNAVEIPSKSIQKLSEASKRNKTYVCVSVTEKENASLYLTQLWFGPNGDLLGKHRKFKATNVEKTIWGDGDGSMAPVFKTEYGNLGGLQCWEHILPLNLAAMGSMNEQIHVASWPSFFPGDGELMGIRACELCSLYYALSNQVYVIMSSMIYTKEMRDMLADTEFKQGLMADGYGCTEIIAPNTEVIARVPRDEEGFAVADVDLNAIIPGKFCTDPTGHYSTPGFLSLTFDQREHVPVKKIGDQANHHLSYEQIQLDQSVS